MTLLAHGVGSRTDLPIPLGLALYGAGAAILISFAALLLFWRTPKLGGPDSGKPLPLAVQRVVDSTAVRSVLQAVALALLVLVVAAALAVSACNTISGAGRDVQAAGSAVSQGAESAKN